MGAVTCDRPGCTVAETGTCLLSHKEHTECPHFRVVNGEQASTPTASTVEPLPVPGSAARHFPPGLELGTEDAGEIMGARYTHLIGILGSWDAGKTCFILSLYLMASRGALPSDYIFAGSETLPGFEARARRLREWKGGPLPDQIVDHTSLADPRQPALLHLGLREAGGLRRRFDVLLTDLPGEWSKNLVDRSDTAGRFAFLRRADGIIIVVDGPLLNSTSKHSEIQRTKHLLSRLVQTVGIEISTPLILLISKCDRLKLTRPMAVDDLEQHARALGFKPEVVLAAAFSCTPETVPNGQGVFEALRKVLVWEGEVPKDSLAESAFAPSPRAFLNFRHRTP